MVANIASFLRFAADWQGANPHGTLAGFVAYLDVYQTAGGELPTSVELSEDLEGVRLMTLYQAKGLILGNRLFHQLRVSEAEAQARLAAFIGAERAPVVSTMGPLPGYAVRERWLYSEIDRTARDPAQVRVDVPEEAVAFFEQEVLVDRRPQNAWVAYHQGELRYRYATLLARRLAPGDGGDERTRGHLAAAGLWCVAAIISLRRRNHAQESDFVGFDCVDRVAGVRQRHQGAGAENSCRLHRRLQ